MEKRRIEFFMPMARVPTATHQEKKWRVVNGKPVSYDPPAVVAARQKLMAHLAKHRPQEAYQHGVRLIVKWLFPLTARYRDGEYKTTRPDTDNLQKLLKDCMTACGFWTDDALVASEICEKFWAAHPGIYVKVEKL